MSASRFGRIAVRNRMQHQNFHGVDVRQAGGSDAAHHPALERVTEQE
jgi:hypothetical protein